MNYHGHGSPVMTINGLTCVFNMPQARRSEFRMVGEVEQEIEQGLPEYAPQTAYNVDDYPCALPEWRRGSATEASYFVPVQTDRGMWLDLNRNQSGHSYHVAALISIQGANPLTAQPVNGTKLEQYSDTCPEHSIPFRSQRFCPQCKFKWPKQNYLASNATPQGLYWLDGFRAKDGTVRQYIFTHDTARGIAAQILGDDRAFAIGVSFFLSKAPKPAPVRMPYPYGNDNYIKGGYEATLGTSPMRGALRTRGTSPIGASLPMEVAAGARIRQHVYDDPESLDFWQGTPAGTLYINYTDAATRDEILASGKYDRTNRGEGPLGGLRVGN